MLLLVLLFRSPHLPVSLVTSPCTLSASILPPGSPLTLFPVNSFIPSPRLPLFCCSFFCQTAQCCVSLSVLLLMVPPSSLLSFAFQSCLPPLSSILLLASNIVSSLSFQVPPSQSFCQLIFLPSFSCHLSFPPLPPFLDFPLFR